MLLFQVPPSGHVQEQSIDLAPFPHHLLAPQPLHVAALHWLPSLGTLKSTKPLCLSYYVSLNSVQKTSWRAHQAPDTIPISNDFLPMVVWAPQHLYHCLPWLTCTPLTASPALPQSTEGRFSRFLSLSSLFLVIFTLWLQSFLPQMTHKCLSLVSQHVPKQTHCPPSQIRLILISYIFLSMASPFSQLSRLETSVLPCISTLILSIPSHRLWSSTD